MNVTLLYILSLLTGGIFGLFKCLLSFVKMALSIHSDNLYRGKGII